MKERDRAFDIAKGIGILCVIAGHLGSDTVTRAVYPFHMPLFFLAAGWFLGEKQSPGRYFLKRCRSLLPAYLTTAVCLCLLNVTQSLFRGYDGARVLHNAASVLLNALYASGSEFNHTPQGISQIGAIWFLPAMLWACACVRWVLSLARQEKTRFLLLAVCFLLCWLSAKRFWLPWDIQAGGCAALYVYLGWAARHYSDAPEIAKAREKYGRWIIPIGTAAWIYDYTLNIYPFLSRAYFPFLPVNVLMSVLIAAGILRLSRLIDRQERLAAVLSFYGRHSLLILCFHLMELDYFPWKSVHAILTERGLHQGWRYALVFALKVLLCTALSVLASSSAPARRAFGLPAKAESNSA